VAPQPWPHQQFERSFRDLDTVIDTMNCGLSVRNLDGTIAFLNQQLLEWLGYTEEELLGQPIQTLLPPEVRDLAQAEMKATEGGDIRARMTVLQRKDSTTFPALFVPQRLLSPNGELVGTFAVVVDLGAIQTAKQAGYQAGDQIRSRLDRIAMELQSISLSTTLPAAEALPLEHPDLEGLTAREKEVLQLLVSGERVPAIAQRLFISQHTVRNHLKSVYRKVGVSTQSELIHKVRMLKESDDDA
jgi:PAS domain S-box-containing protein